MAIQKFKKAVLFVICMFELCSYRCVTISIKVTTRRPTWPISIQNLYPSVFKSVESYLYFHSCNCRDVTKNTVYVTPEEQTNQP